MWTKSATELAAAVRSGELGAAEVIRAHLDRIAEVNPAVNAVTRTLEREALAAAEDIDRRRAAGEQLGELAGVPLTVKENIDVRGSATTHGVPHFEHAIAEADAPQVRRLREADAIPIGRANMPDLTLGGNATTSQLFGTTVNPWDSTKTPGGTSGGDGAAVASGMAALGLGNDSGGSIRLPAMCCGVAGLKASHGRLPSDHRVAGTEPTLASQLLPVDGPIARTVADLRAAFRVLAGTDPNDPLALPVPLDGPPLEAPIRVGVVANPGGFGVHQGIRAEVERAAATLSDAGYAVEEAELPRYPDALAAYGKLISTEFTLSWPRIRPLLTEESARHLELSFERMPPCSLADYVSVIGERHGIVRDWMRFQQRYPLVVGPVCTQPIGPARPRVLGPEEHMRATLSISLNTATSLVGVPAVAVPTGVVDGVPMGVQVIGARFREDLCLSAAEVIERRFGTFTPVTPGWKGEQAWTR
ncbi:amidase [Allokutzneria sp. A3M-2-11 16]|uniref:amidase n=1 Tax=Allokutzneria sp. A3M-2-11 16 TaxID=2962043 RepID=UPI0020B6AF0A|nr:amidase [Allokutzneria sp. A3M-2-11 16]MCP3798327.1 amidase [Allokutzneria sp. A3M-2-11 16]